MVHFSKEYWLVLGLMALTFATVHWVRAPKTPAETAVDLARFPKQLEGWQAKEDSLDERVERVLNTDQTLLRYYTNANGSRIELFVGYYRDQKFGAQVHSPLHCLPGSGWTIVRHDKMPLPFNPQYQANKLHIDRNNENLLVLYWFASDGSVVQSEFDLKWRLLANAFQRHATSVYFYRVVTVFKTTEEELALQTIQDFLRAASPFLQNAS